MSADLLRQLEPAGQALASWIGPVTLWTAVLFAAARLLDGALARGARASWRMALYAPVGLRLLLPLGWSIPLRLAPRTLTLLTPRGGGPLAIVGTHAEAPPVSWHAALAVAYAVVALALGALAVRARLRLARERRTGTVLDVGSLGGGCTVVLHDTLGPMVVGLLRPSIVVPRRLVEEGGEATLACVLRHELAHVRRGDPWLSAAMQLVTAAAWPILPVWLAAARVRHLVELACDEVALEGASPAQRREYGHALLDVAEWDARVVADLGAGELHFGATLRARIEALASQRLWPGGAQAGLVLSVAAVFAACSAAAPSPAPATAPPQERNDGAARVASYLRPFTTNGVTLRTAADLRSHCPHFAARLGDGRDGDGWRAWLGGPVGDAPADEVALCRHPTVLEAVSTGFWVAEGLNTVGQIALDLASAYETEQARTGKSRTALCPSGSPEPAVAQAPGTDYAPTAQDWGAPGWSCLHFGMSIPFHFQYAFTTDDRGFVITAQGSNTTRGAPRHVKLSLSGKLMPDGVLDIAPNIEQVWE